jgi:hypothetical protein
MASRLATSATSTLNLVVAGCAGVAAAALHSVPLALIGGTAYLALVAWDMLGRLPGESDPLPDPAKLTDPEAGNAAKALRAARRELNDVLETSPRQIRNYMAMSTASVVEMEQRAAHLIERLEQLAVYLKTTDRKAVESQLQKLRSQAEATTDVEARAQLEGAVAARDEQVRALYELQEARERLSAHLARLIAAYEGLPARVVRMRALDGQAADALSGDMGAELDRMNHEIAAFEETLASLAKRVPA